MSGETETYCRAENTVLLANSFYVFISLFTEEIFVLFAVQLSRVDSIITAGDAINRMLILNCQVTSFAHQPVCRSSRMSDIFGPVLSDHRSSLLLSDWFGFCL